MRPRSRLTPLLGTLLLAAGCLTSGPVTPPPPADAGPVVPPDAGPGPTGLTPMGKACSADADCASGLRCLGPAIGGPTSRRYCAPTCSTEQDCQAFSLTSYQIQVPETVTPLGGKPTPNIWASGTLSRGFACQPVPGTPSTQKYCQFACPDLAALAPDDSGNLNSCYCLPGYSLTADLAGCQYGAGHECSIFSYGTDATRQALLDQYGIQTQKAACDGCNSDTTFTDSFDCHTNVFICELTTTSMNGDCAEGVTVDQLQQCFNASTNFSCDCDAGCAQSCVDADACYGCCTCQPTSEPLPPPTCGSTPDGGVPDGGGPDAGPGPDGPTPDGGGVIPTSPTMIQELTNGTVGPDTEVTLSRKFVTAVHAASGDTGLVFYLQEPAGQGTADHDYPRRAGIGLFATNAETSRLGLGNLAIAQCVSLMATTTVFHQAPQLIRITAIETHDLATCGTRPTVRNVENSGFAALAQQGGQVPPDGLDFVGVLVEFHDLVALSVSNADGDFTVGDGAGPGTLRVTRFLYDGTLPPTQIGQTFSVLRGVYNRYDSSFQLEPRHSGDLSTP